MSLPIMNYFYLDGRDSREWNIGLSGTGVYNAPARDVTVIDIPGKSGSAIIDNGRYFNTTVTYPCWIAREFADNIDDFRGFLAAHADGYYRLEDSYHPDEYRMATYEGPFEAVPGTRNRSGRFDVAFNCQPQRWLKSGEAWIEATNGMTINNPTSFGAHPVVRVYSTGQVGFGGETITVMDMNGQEYLDIDTALYVATKDGYIFPNAVTISSSGVTLIGEQSVWFDVSKCIIQPRWWTL